MERCATRLEAGPIALDDPTAAKCFDIRPYFPEVLKSAIIEAQSPGTLRTRLSNLVQAEASARQAVRPERDYGDMPLIVLTRGQLGSPPGPPQPGRPAEADAEGRAMERLWVEAHEELSKLSTLGEHRTVVGAGHSIQADRPEAVIEAVESVIARARR